MHIIWPIFVQFGFTMNLTHLSPVQYWFIHIQKEEFIHKVSGTKLW
jgi:hypothetical protein